MLAHYCNLENHGLCVFFGGGGRMTLYHIVWCVPLIRIEWWMKFLVESEFASLCTTVPLLYWIFIVCSELSHRETLFGYFFFCWGNGIGRGNVPWPNGSEAQSIDQWQNSHKKRLSFFLPKCLEHLSCYAVYDHQWLIFCPISFGEWLYIRMDVYGSCKSFQYMIRTYYIVFNLPAICLKLIGSYWLQLNWTRWLLHCCQLFFLLVQFYPIITKFRYH